MPILSFAVIPSKGFSPILFVSSLDLTYFLYVKMSYLFSSFFLFFFVVRFLNKKNLWDGSLKGTTQNDKKPEADRLTDKAAEKKATINYVVAISVYSFTPIFKVKTFNLYCLCSAFYYKIMAFVESFRRIMKDYY